MDKTKTQPEIILEVYTSNDKYYLTGHALFALGVEIPLENRDDFYDYDLEEIKKLITTYEINNPKVELRIEKIAMNDEDLKILNQPKKAK